MNAETFYGGSLRLVMSSGTPYPVHPKIKRSYRLAPTSTGRIARLPDARRLKTGGPVLMFFNEGPHTVTIQKNDGATLTTIPSNGCLDLYLRKNDTQAGTWVMRAKTKNTARTLYKPSRSLPSSFPPPPEPDAQTVCLAFLLRDCSRVNPDLFTKTDLTAYLGKVVRVAGQPGVYLVSRTDPHTHVYTSVTVYQSWANCSDAQTYEGCSSCSIERCCDGTVRNGSDGSMASCASSSIFYDGEYRTVDYFEDGGGSGLNLGTLCGCRWEWTRSGEPCPPSNPDLGIERFGRVVWCFTYGSIVDEDQMACCCVKEPSHGSCMCVSEI